MVQLWMPGYKRLAENSLKLVASILEGMNVSWFVGRGTFIGAIRDNDFMSHDTDVDIEIFDVNQNQIKEIIDKISTHIPLDVIKDYRGYIYLIGFRISRMRVDIDVWYRDGEWMVSADESKPYVKEGYSFYKLPSNLFKTKSIDFRNIKINVPIESEKFLELYIGEDWDVRKTHDVYITKRDSPSLVPKSECPIFKNLEEI